MVGRMRTLACLILAAGLALQKAGVIDTKVNVEKVLNELIDERFNATLSN